MSVLTPPAPIATPHAAAPLPESERARFARDGFLVIRGLIPPERLAELRQAYERAAERHQAAHAQEWETSPQPRVHLHEPGIVAPDNAAAIAFWCEEPVLALAQALLACPDPAVTQMALLCHPRRDHGPAGWHRDVHPHDMAPLGVLQDDLIENGPRYVQWNIPLYEDAVLWVVPGSHRRLNTAEENQALAENPCAPLPGGVPVPLAAGDGVVYVNFLLHWGSDYAARLRRTLHGGHALFTQQDGREPFLAAVDARTRATFARWSVRTRRLEDLTELALRAALGRDGRAYAAALDGLQPGIGDAGRLALSCYLSKLAWQLRLRLVGEAGVPPALRAIAYPHHPITLNWGPTFVARFTAAEATALSERFAALDARLRGPEPQYVPGFQSGPMEFRFERLAEPFTVADLIASWR